MSHLLLDEMFSGSIAEQLRAKGHDVLAVVADPALVGLADEQILDLIAQSVSNSSKPRARSSRSARFSCRILSASA